jgi:hypothetical protein
MRCRPLRVTCPQSFRGRVETWVWTCDDGADATGGRAFYGFNIVDDLGRPLLNIAFETQKEAEAVHIAIKPIIAQAKLITAFPTS